LIAVSTPSAPELLRKGLLGAVDGHEGIQLFGQGDVRLIGADDGAEVDQVGRLCLQRGDHFRRRVADVERADARGEVDEGVAVHVGDGGVVRAGCHDRRGAEGGAGDRGVAAVKHGLTLWAGQRWCGC
jgi:hypothetical protein